MPRRTAEKNVQVGIITEIVRHLRLVWRLLGDRRVPFSLKLLIPAALAYLISPIDLIPDIFVTMFGLGFVDDFAVVLMAVRLFLSLAPQHVVSEYTGDGDVDVTPGESIPGTYRIVNEN